LDSFRITVYGLSSLAYSLRCNGSGWAAAVGTERDARAKTRSLRPRARQVLKGQWRRRQGRTDAAISPTAFLGVAACASLPAEAGSATAPSKPSTRPYYGPLLAVASTANEFRFRSPLHSGPCRFSDMEDIGAPQMDTRGVFEYKRCRKCGFALRVFLREIPNAALIAELRHTFQFAFTRGYSG
jgi:hypothetical protein